MSRMSTSIKDHESWGALKIYNYYLLMSDLFLKNTRLKKNVIKISKVNIN